MQFIQEHLVSNIEEIETTLNTINDRFQPSEVYHAQSDTKQVKMLSVRYCSLLKF